MDFTYSYIPQITKYNSILYYQSTVFFKYCCAVIQLCLCSSFILYFLCIRLPHHSSVLTQLVTCNTCTWHARHGVTESLGKLILEAWCLDAFIILCSVNKHDHTSLTIIQRADCHKQIFPGKEQKRLASNIKDKRGALSNSIKERGSLFKFCISKRGTCVWARVTRPMETWLP